MNTTTKIIAIALTAITTACTPKTSQNKSKLIVYYSQTGTTEALVNELQSLLGADIDTIIPLNPYPNDYAATIERWSQERAANTTPEIAPLAHNPAAYDTIFLAFPIWGDSYAQPVKTFLENNDFSGKTIITLATFGSGGLDPATNDIARAQPNATVVRGYGIRAVRISYAHDELTRFLIENGHIAGTITPLQPYGTQHPVTPEEQDIFTAATSTYTFPLGTPVTAATRPTPDPNGNTHYRFEVQSPAPDGTMRQSVILIQKPASPDSIPQFTEVIR